MKTCFVHLNAVKITINTDGVEETLTFRTKKQADTKLLELFKDGYTFDRLGWAAHQKRYTPDCPYEIARAVIAKVTA